MADASLSLSTMNGVENKEIDVKQTFTRKRGQVRTPLICAKKSMMAKGDHLLLKAANGQNAAGSKLANVTHKTAFTQMQLEQLIRMAADQKTKILIAIGDFEFSIFVMGKKLICRSFTDDMETVATELSRYVHLFFQKKKYDVEFYFNHGQKETLKIRPRHAALFSKIENKHMAEKGLPLPRGIQERRDRLVVTMNHICFVGHEQDFNAIMHLFEDFRARVQLHECQGVRYPPDV